MPFNVNKCHTLKMGTRNQKHEYEMSGVKLESVHCVKDLGVTIASNLKFSQHCKDTACKANRMMGFLNRNFSFKNKDIRNSTYVYNFSQTPFGVYKGYSKIRSCPA